LIMLRLTNLCGFGAGQSGIKARFVNEYGLSFAGTASATATVPAVDLQLAPSLTKQILVFVGAKVPIITNITINGVRAGFISVGGGFLVAASAVYAGAGPFNIVVTTSAVNSEVGGVIVYEVDSAAPLYEAMRGASFFQPSANMRQPLGSIIIGGGYGATDTTAFTWSGLTENFDADIGDYRLSSAVDLTPAAALTARSISANPPTTPTLINLGIMPLGVTGQIRGGFEGWSAATGSASTFTFATTMVNNFNELGNPELVIAVTTEANVTISGVTHNGVAMTSRGSVVNTGATPDLIVHFFSISLTNGAASGNIVVTASASVAGIICNIGVWTLYGVNSYGTLVSNQGAPGTGATTSPVVNAGGAALFACITGNSTGISLSGGDSKTETGGGTLDSLFADIIPSVGTTENITTTFSSQAFAQAALPVNP
jgi:hypothetical protein